MFLRNAGIFFLLLWEMIENCKGFFNQQQCVCPNGNVGTTCNKYGYFKEGLSSEQEREILDYHNNMRSKVAKGEEFRSSSGHSQLKASNMLKMEWNNTLAQFAQNAATKCTFEHTCGKDDKQECPDYFLRHSGENIAYNANSATKNVQPNYRDWYESEVSLFNPKWIYPFKANKNSEGTYLHYTQMLWATTNQLGCGAVTYKGKIGENDYYINLIFCEYYPSGNIIDQEMYKKGVPCTDCPSGTHCNDNSLCSKTNNGQANSGYKRTEMEKPDERRSTQTEREIVRSPATQYETYGRNYESRGDSGGYRSPGRTHESYRRNHETGRDSGGQRLPARSGESFGRADRSWTNTGEYGALAKPDDGYGGSRRSNGRHRSPVGTAERHGRTDEPRRNNGRQRSPARSDERHGRADEYRRDNRRYRPSTSSTDYNRMTDRYRTNGRRNSGKRRTRRCGPQNGRRVFDMTYTLVSKSTVFSSAACIRSAMFPIVGILSINMSLIVKSGTIRVENGSVSYEEIKTYATIWNTSDMNNCTKKGDESSDAMVESSVEMMLSRKHAVFISDGCLGKGEKEVPIVYFPLNGTTQKVKSGIITLTMGKVHSTGINLEFTPGKMNCGKKSNRV